MFHALTIDASGSVIASGKFVAKINQDQFGRRTLHRLASVSPFKIAKPGLGDVTHVFHTDRLVQVVADLLNA